MKDMLIVELGLPNNYFHQETGDYEYLRELALRSYDKFKWYIVSPKYVHIPVKIKK